MDWCIWNGHFPQILKRCFQRLKESPPKNEPFHTPCHSSILRKASLNPLQKTTSVQGNEWKLSTTQMRCIGTLVGQAEVFESCLKRRRDRRDQCLLGPPPPQMFQISQQNREKMPPKRPSKLSVLRSMYRHRSIKSRGVRWVSERGGATAIHLKFRCLGHVHELPQECHLSWHEAPKRPA